MFRRYSVSYVDDTVVVVLRGDVPSRRYAWMGAVDALLLAGNQRFVISLEEVDLQGRADARFVGTLAQRVRDCGGAVVVVPPGSPGARTLLRRAPATANLVLGETVEAGVHWLAAGVGT